ncbi:MAG: hypothetical protein GXO75_04945 [Calditrichaeota bacterium]|nr:hypothetical protein [Calditrichota bacterium]
MQNKKLNCPYLKLIRQAEKIFDDTMISIKLYSDGSGMLYDINDVFIFDFWCLEDFEEKLKQRKKEKQK